MRGIADTGFIVAAIHRSDRYHPWAAQIAGQITEPLLTCEAVLTEAAFHLRSSSAVLALVRAGMLKIAFDAQRELDRLLELAQSYAGRPAGLGGSLLDPHERATSSTRGRHNRHR